MHTMCCEAACLQFSIHHKRLHGTLFIPNFHTLNNTRFTALFPGLPGWADTRKEKTNLDFTEARDSEWQWHQLGRMQVCTSLQTDNHASTPPLSFYRPDALPVIQTTASKHWRHTLNNKYKICNSCLIRSLGHRVNIVTLNASHLNNATLMLN